MNTMYVQMYNQPTKREHTMYCTTIWLDGDPCDANLTTSGICPDRRNHLRPGATPERGTLPFVSMAAAATYASGAGIAESKPRQGHLTLVSSGGA